MKSSIIIFCAIFTIAFCEIPIPEKYRNAKSISEHPKMQEFYKRNMKSMENSNIQPFIVGGANATLGQIPHQVLIFINMPNGDVYLCGGVLIQREWVLTVSALIF